MATFTPPSEIAFVQAPTTSWYEDSRKYVKNQTSTNTAQYFLAESDGTEVSVNQFDIKFTDSSGALSLNVNPTDGSNHPYYFRINNTGTTHANWDVSVGDDIWCFQQNYTTVICRFTVPDFFPSSGGGGGSGGGSSSTKVFRNFW